MSKGEHMIENTNTERAKMALALDALIFPQGDGAAILAQEARGQAQLVASESLPTDTGGHDADFIALGFTFGDPDPGDPLFRPATLPAYWTRRATDHSMWSEIVDGDDRVRVMIFYKAAFYDRRANMRIANVDKYVGRVVRGCGGLTLDDSWATHDAVMAALVEIERREREYGWPEALRNADRARLLIESLA
jgi:hypothetical protein